MPQFCICNTEVNKTVWLPLALTLFFHYLSALFMWPVSFSVRELSLPISLCGPVHEASRVWAPPGALAVSPLITKSPQPAQGFPLKSGEHLPDGNLVGSLRSFFLFPFSRVFFFLTVPGSERDIWSWRKEATRSQVDTLPAIITNPEIGIFTLVWMIRCKYKF